jgi:NAD-dependent dihydropyrimidine dehydrogenase PreA subunit
MIKRKIIHIDEELCNGCGQCIPACAEGALAIIDGKAKVVADKFCDGLGACLGHCPTGALKIIEREADEFDEEAAMAHVQAQKVAQTQKSESDRREIQKEGHGGCPSAKPMVLSPCDQANIPRAQEGSNLSHWPVQIRLIPPSAPFLKEANLLVTADCVPVSLPSFQSQFVPGKVVMLGCPKFDPANEYVQKFVQIFSENDIQSVVVLEMEVPCCSGLHKIVLQALKLAGKSLPVKRIIVRRNGQIEEKPLSTF